jgi:regulator of sigma E protease
VQRSAVSIEVRSDRGERERRKLDLSGLTTADLDSDFLRTLGLMRFQPDLPPEIGRVTAGGAAERAGLKAGDKIVSIDNQEIRSINHAIKIIREHPEKTLPVVVRRGGATLPAIAITPDVHIEKDGRKVGRINAVLQNRQEELAKYLTVVRYGPLDSVTRAMDKTWETSIFSLKMLGKMIVGEVSLKNLSGPITIADYAGQSAQSGLTSYLLFLALISISLGVLNLLPIPLLDGGHLMYYTFEIFTGSPVSDRAIEIGQHIGIALLFTLMAFALFNDINRLISG